MGDSWEDDDFEANLNALTAKVAVSASANPNSKFADEEEDAPQEEVVRKAAPTAEQIEAARLKAQQDEIALQNKVKFDREKGETPEQRRAREKAQVEEADHQLSNELFQGDGSSSSSSSSSSKAAAGAGAGSGIASVTLKTNQDHTNFALLVSKKFDNSTSINISSFYKSLSDKLCDQLTTETLEQVIAQLTTLREARKKTEAKKTVTKSKKEIKAQQKKHNDTFGGDFEDEEYASFANKYEDDFM